MRFDFKRLRSRALALLFVVVLSVVLGGASFNTVLDVHAATSTSIHLSQATGWINSQNIVSGSGFAKAEQVNISFDGTLVATTQVLTDLSIVGAPTGRIRALFSVPVTASLGAHVVKAVGQTSGRSAQASLAVAPAWAQFGFDAAHTGFNPDESILSPANVAQLTPAWIYHTPGFVSPSSPAVANGLVYIGDQEGWLHALDAFSGTEVWRQGFDGTPFAPATTNTLVYTSSLGSFLQVNDEASGQLQWIGLPAVFGSSPTLANGVLYQDAANGNGLYAFSANGCGQSTCTALWNGKIVGNSFEAAPAVANGVVYVGGDNGNVYAFSTSTCGTDCAPLWQGTTGGTIASPVIANNVVYLSAVHSLYAFAASGCGAGVCAPLWSGTIGGFLDATAAIANGVVYVGGDDGTLYAFNAAGCGQATCQPLWTAATGGPFHAAPAVANGVVYIGSENGKLYAFNAAGCGGATCAPLWSYTTVGPIESSPAVTDGMVFVGSGDTSGDNDVYAFHLP